MKAYTVDDDGEGAVVVFAEKNVVARRIGANELGCAFGDVSCCRAPDLDSYAPGPVPPLILWDAGWWFGCQRCDGMARQDSGGKPTEAGFLCEGCATSEKGDGDAC